MPRRHIAISGQKSSLIVVAATAEDALVIFDSMEKTDSEQVTIRDVDGHTVDPESIRSNSKFDPVLI
jgi:hypothetical protein